MAKKIKITIEMTVPDAVADNPSIMESLDNAAQDAVRPYLIDYYKKPTSLQMTTEDVKE